jgi:phage shock protein PspC (stress-responsive transcriptional regulator)
MKKTTTITIGKRHFVFEEDAFTKLESYLNSLKQFFTNYPDKEEIIEDIESRISESLFNESRTFGYVTTEHIDKIIDQIGQVQDFEIGQTGAQKNSQTNEEKQSSQDKKSKPFKKFYRNSDDEILGGVASGIAAYFGVDTLWIRLGFILSTFVTGGFGVFVYIALWLVAPRAITESEKSQMRGEPVSLKNLESYVKEKADNIKHKKM